MDMGAPDNSGSAYRGSNPCLPVMSLGLIELLVLGGGVVLVAVLVLVLSKK
jgi:hypothetical protein